MSDVKDFIAEIETMYRRDYKDEENSFIRDRLFAKKYEQPVLIRALEEIERIDSEYLPSPKKVLSVVEKSAYDMTPKKPIEQEKLGGDKTRRQFDIGVALRQMFFSNKHTRQEILDKIREADKVKPDGGWDKVGMTIERYYSDGKYDLSKSPANYIMED